MEQLQKQQGLISWYYFSSQKTWVPYSDNIQMCLEDCFQKYTSNNQSNPTVQCLINNKNYILDVKDNSQKNKKTGTTRKIIRIADDDKQNFEQLNQSIQNQLQNQQKLKNQNQWQFQGDQGWTSYDETSQKELNKKYNLYKSSANNENSTFQISIRSTIYKINFSNMIQQNTKYQTIRSIRFLQNADQ